VVRVPEGTTVRDHETGAVLADLVTHGDRWLAARGGRGGRGNLRFLTNALMNSAGRLPPEQAAWFGWIVFLGDHLTPRIGA